MLCQTVLWIDWVRSVALAQCTIVCARMRCTMQLITSVRIQSLGHTCSLQEMSRNVAKTQDSSTHSPSVSVRPYYRRWSQIALIWIWNSKIHDPESAISYEVGSYKMGTVYFSFSCHLSVNNYRVSLRRVNGGRVAFTIIILRVDKEVKWIFQVFRIQIIHKSWRSSSFKAHVAL